MTANDVLFDININLSKEISIEVIKGHKCIFKKKNQLLIKKWVSTTKYSFTLELKISKKMH